MKPAQAEYLLVLVSTAYENMQSPQDLTGFGFPLEEVEHMIAAYRSMPHVKDEPDSWATVTLRRYMVRRSMGKESDRSLFRRIKDRFYGKKESTECFSLFAIYNDRKAMGIWSYGTESGHLSGIEKDFRRQFILLTHRMYQENVAPSDEVISEILSSMFGPVAPETIRKDRELLQLPHYITDQYRRA